MADKNARITYQTLYSTDDPSMHLMSIEYQTSAGAVASLLVPRRLMNRPSELRDRLTNADAQGDLTNEGLRKALDDGPRRRVHLTDRTGWDGSVFVFPNETSRRANTGRDVVHRLSLEAPDDDKWFAGGLRAWRASMAKLFTHSDLGVFIVSAAFAAPLLAFFSSPTGLLWNLAGESGSGKTTMLRVAQSVMRRAGPADLASTDITLAGLEELTAEHNELPLCIDEFGSATATPGAVRSLGRALGYRTYSGRTRRRAASAQIAMGRGQLFFRPCVLTSSEARLAEIIGERFAGEEVRFIDLVVQPKEKGGVLTVDGIATLSFEAGRDLLAEIEHTISVNYGLALPRFVWWLASDREFYEAQAKKYAATFVAKMIAKGSARVEDSRLLAAYGKVYAAGRLGAEANCLPVTKKRLFQAVAAIFRQSDLARRQSEERLVHVVADIVRLAADPARCVETKRKAVENASGTVCAIRRDHRDRPVIGIMPEAFEELVSPCGLSPILRVLKAGSVLVPGPKTDQRQMAVQGLAKSERPYFYCLDIERLQALASSLGLRLGASVTD